MNYDKKYGVALTGTGRIFVPMVKRASIDYAIGSDWTPATGDVVLVRDGGAPQNIATLPVAVTVGNAALWAFAFSAAEMQAKSILCVICDALTGKAVEDNAFEVRTFGHASAMFPSDPSADNTLIEMLFQRAAGTNVAFTVGSGSTVGSVVTSALDPAPTSNGQYAGRIMIFDRNTPTAALRCQAAPIFGMTAGGVISIESGKEFNTAPASGDYGIIV